MAKQDKPNLSELIKQIDTHNLDSDQFEDYYTTEQNKARPKPKKEDWE